MNIFYLSHNTNICAKEHVDKHVRKMIVEYAQLLSTAHRVLDGIHYTTRINNRAKNFWVLTDSCKESMLYKATHFNHPSAKWVRESKRHYDWLYDLWSKLLQEYEFRFSKIHKSKTLLIALNDSPINLNDNGWSPPALAIPDIYKKSTAIESYRYYYKEGKKHLHTYTNRSYPKWLKEVS